MYGYAYTCTVNAMQCNVKICYVMACMFCMHFFLKTCMYIYMYRGMFMYRDKFFFFHTQRGIDIVRIYVCIALIFELFRLMIAIYMHACTRCITSHLITLHYILTHYIHNLTLHKITLQNIT